ncbi:MAG: hypothetical protein K6A68_06345 [Clostridiales bacterium]|nr:hypothetical protein [Clostridiales bacterium]
MQFDHYLRYDEMTDWLHRLVAAHPDLALLESIGKTYEGRDIWLITVTDFSSGKPESKSALSMDGGIHATEVASTMGVLYTLDALLSGFGSDASVTELLRLHTVYAIPRINADGAELVLTTPGRVRGSVEKFYPPQNGVVPQDINGDGEILQMRIPDPAGRWKVSDFDPRVMEAREPADRKGPFYTLVPEGMVSGEDLIALHEAPPQEGLDPNRQFPFDWSSHVPDESGQNTSGPAPLHDIEVQVLQQFILAHPNIAFEMNFHTYGGQHISPLDFCPREKPQEGDANLFDSLGKMFHGLTGYQTSGIFPPGAMDIAHGSYTTYLFWTLGIPAYVTELWDFLVQTDPERPESWSMYFTACREQFVRENSTQLKWDEEKNGGKGFIPWTPFRHPQLGDVEIGGWKEKFTRWNPPLHLLPGVLEKARSTAMASLSLLPSLEMCVHSIHPNGKGQFTLELAVRNTGFLPTSASQQAVLHGFGNDLTLMVRSGKKEETCALLPLDGFSSRRVLIHVHGRKGQKVHLRLSAIRAGAVETDCILP